MKFCEACGHPKARHAANGGCDVSNCHCTARYGEPAENKRGVHDWPTIDDMAEEIVDLEKKAASLASDKEKLEEEAQRLSAAAMADKSRMTDLREMLEGQKVRAEAFKDECEQWRHFWDRLTTKALGRQPNPRPDIARAASEGEMILKLLDRERNPADDLAEFLAREAVQYERNTLRVFMGFLKIAAALGDEASLWEFREIMEAYRKVEEGRQ